MKKWIQCLPSGENRQEEVNDKEDSEQSCMSDGK